MQKSRATITACDPSQRLVQGQLKDGGQISIAVFEIPPAFRWPIVGEIWSIYKENYYWMLGGRVNVDSQEVSPVTEMQPGELRLDGSKLYLDKTFAVTGNTLDGTGTLSLLEQLDSLGIIDNQVINNGFPSGSGSGDKTFDYTQGVASSLWTITHDLDKFPSVIVLDSAGSLSVGQIDYISPNVLTLTFSAAFSGVAYLN